MGFFASGRWLSAVLRMASTSARSCGRPEASFATIRSSRDMKQTFSPLAWSITVSNTTFPSHVKIDARNIGKHIKTARIPPETEETAAVLEVFRANALNRRAKFSQRSIDRSSVGMVRFYENIDVLREARLCVKDDGITANNQVSNAMGMEGGQKVFVILEHPAPSPNL